MQGAQIRSLGRELRSHMLHGQKKKKKKIWLLDLKPNVDPGWQQEKRDEFSFPQKTILNVNVPGLESEDVAGVAITELGSRMFTDVYEKRVDPRGKVYYWMAGEVTSEPEGATTDIAAIRNNKISITPVTFEMTRNSIMSELNNVLCDDSSCDWY